MEAQHTLYQITNTANGRYYIGAHSCRCKPRCYYMGSGVIIRRAIEKHGYSAFKKDILATVPTASLLFRIESAVVDQAFVDRQDTYNTAKGGTKPPSRAGIPNSEEARRKISVALSGRSHTAEHIAKVVAANKGKRRTLAQRQAIGDFHRGRKQPIDLVAKRSAALTGRTLTAEHRQRIGAANRGKTTSVESRRKMSLSARNRKRR